jgi:hypothetical protein
MDADTTRHSDDEPLSEPPRVRRSHARSASLLAATSLLGLAVAITLLEALAPPAILELAGLLLVSAALLASPAVGIAILLRERRSSD